MKIEYLGHSCFKLTDKAGHTVVTDPYTGVGYELPKGLCADIVTVSHGHFDHAYTAGVSAHRVVSELSGCKQDWVKIEGIFSYHDPEKGRLRGHNIIYKITVDGLTVCHLGDIGEPCTPELAEKIGEVDVLLVPVGGTYTVDAVGACAYCKMLAAKLIVPMHYRPADGSLDIAGVERFLTLCPTSQRRDAIGVAEIDENSRGILYMEREVNEK